ncbi:MAG: hypothetical protein GOV00_03105 [Candidatus Altiarchaeota archaeon]|nr:hypothetical protein [Candidatus Altiarchaeota archaeon]
MKWIFFLLVVLMVPVLATTYDEGNLPIWISGGDSFITDDGHTVKIVDVSPNYIQLSVGSGTIRSMRVDDTTSYWACILPTECEVFVWLSEIYDGKARMMVSTELADFRIVNTTHTKLQYPDLPCYPDGYNASFYQGAGKYSLKMGDAVSLNNLTLVFSDTFTSRGGEGAKLIIYDYARCDYLGSVKVLINQTWGHSIQDVDLRVSGYGYSYKRGVVELFVITRPLILWDFWRMLLWGGLIVVSVALIFWIVFKWKPLPEEEEEEEETFKPIEDEDTPFMTYLKEKESVLGRTEDEDESEEGKKEKFKAKIKSKVRAFFGKSEY